MTNVGFSSQVLKGTPVRPDGDPILVGPPTDPGEVGMRALDGCWLLVYVGFVVCLHQVQRRQGNSGQDVDFDVGWGFVVSVGEGSRIDGSKGCGGIDGIWTGEMRSMGIEEGSGRNGAILV